MTAALAVFLAGAALVLSIYTNAESRRAARKWRQAAEGWERQATRWRAVAERRGRQLEAAPPGRP